MIQHEFEKRKNKQTVETTSSLALHQTPVYYEKDLGRLKREIEYRRFLAVASLNTFVQDKKKGEQENMHACC